LNLINRLNRSDLLNEQHLFRSGKITGFDLININSGSYLFPLLVQAIPDNRFTASRLEFIDEDFDFLALEVVNFYGNKNW